MYSVQYYVHLFCLLWSLNLGTPTISNSAVHDVVGGLATRCPTDLLLVIDNSGSVRSVFEHEKTIATSLVSAMDSTSAENNTRVALIHYSSKPVLAFPFDRFADATSIVDEIQSLQPVGLLTHTAEALKLAAEDFAKNSRKNSNRILLIITDGHSQNTPEQLEQAVQLLRTERVYVYTATASEYPDPFEMDIYSSQHRDRVFLRNNVTSMPLVIARFVASGGCLPEVTPGTVDSLSPWDSLESFLASTTTRFIHSKPSTMTPFQSNGIHSELTRTRSTVTSTSTSTSMTITTSTTTSTPTSTSTFTTTSSIITSTISPNEELSTTLLSGFGNPPLHLFSRRFTPVTRGQQPESTSSPATQSILSSTELEGAHPSATKASTTLRTAVPDSAVSIIRALPPAFSPFSGTTTLQKVALWSSTLPEEAESPSARPQRSTPVPPIIKQYLQPPSLVNQSQSQGDYTLNS